MADELKAPLPDDVAKMVERLREAATDHCTMGLGYHWNLHDDSADLIERLARQVPPQEIYLVTNRTSFVAFATAERANKYIGSFSGSVGGGMSVSRIPVIAAGEKKP